MCGLQTCIGHVLDCVENRARHGFRCRIGEDDMLLFPRIGVLSLDTMERVKYFGLRSVNACPICRKRKGRSITRQATCHNPEEVDQLYSLANVPDEDTRTRPLQHTRKRARDRLARHGFNYKKRCRLSEHVHHAVTLIPSVGVRMFAGLARYERMHVWFIAYCTYLLELLVKSVPCQEYKRVVEVVQQCQEFRDPHTGATHPRLPSVLKMTHLTAERRVRAVFYWAHVLGLRANAVLQPIRLVCQRAVSALQLLLISVRGHRSYTSREMHVLFRGVGREFFSALEELSQFHEQRAYNKKLVKFQRDPDRNKEPVLYTPTNRHVKILCRIRGTY